MLVDMSSRSAPSAASLATCLVMAVGHQALDPWALGASTPHPSPNEESICVIAPRLTTLPNGTVQAVVALRAPTLFAQGQFAAVWLEQNGRLLWQRQAGAHGPIEGPMPWPLAPLQPGELLQLRLRPLTAANDSVATVQLMAAPATVLARNQALLRNLANDPAAWLEAVNQALNRQDIPLAWGLLFAFEGPRSPELDALRLTVFERGCGESATPP
jgi:hypothetical protein